MLKKIFNFNHPVPDPAQKETLGITIDSTWKFSRIDQPDRTFTAHIWDFGGQEIQYHLHQFFLADRSLYVLLLDDRKEAQTLDYWFNIIRILGEGSPVLVVRNEIGKTAVGSLSFDFKKYEDRYPDLAMEWVTVDFSQNDSRLTSLILRIQEKLSTLKHLQDRIPAGWPRVRELLASPDHREKNTIPWRDFKTLCGLCDIRREEDQLVLSHYFHCLGLIQHFRNDPPLFETVFLNPEWLTRAVYTILSDAKIPQHGGAFSRQWLFDQWGSEYSIEEKNKLLLLMQKREFDLCYEYVHHGRTHYLAPDLMPDIRPLVAQNWDKTDNLSFRYQYPFMPQGLIGRLIVRTSTFIELDPNHKQLVWKSGAILKRDGVQAFLREDLTRRGEKIIEIRTCGGREFDRLTFLSYIRSELESIHTDFFPNLPISPQIPCPCEECRTNSHPYHFPYETLMRALDKEKSTVECQISFTNVDLLPLLVTYGLAYPRDPNDNDKFPNNGRTIIVNGDYYNIPGQAAAVGRHPTARENTFQQE